MASLVADHPTHCGGKLVDPARGYRHVYQTTDLQSAVTLGTKKSTY